VALFGAMGILHRMQHQENELDLRHTKPGLHPEGEVVTEGHAVIHEHHPVHRRGFRLRVWAGIGVFVTLLLVGLGVMAVLADRAAPSDQTPLVEQTPEIMTGHERPETTAPPAPEETPLPVQSSTTTPAEEPVDDPVVPEPDKDPAPEPQPAEEPEEEPAVPVVPDQRANLNYNYGIAMAETLSVVSQTELQKRLDDVVELGVGWIRVDLAWSTIQWRDKDTYYWDAFDRIVAEANERGIRVLPILTYTPGWARPSDCTHTKKCGPRDPDEFAVFARKAAERYAPQGIDTWEIWNEPNMGIFWAPHADPARYTELLQAAYTAIKSVDSDAFVVSAGLAPVATRGANMTAREFVEAMYVYGAKNYFDALGFHPYTYPVLPTDYNDQNAWSQMEETKWSLRGIMKYNGDGDKDIWLTEVGAPTGGPGARANSNDFSRWNVPDHVTESYQAELLESAVRENETVDWTGPFFWYSYQDLGTNTSDRENFFGIRRYDGSAKPAYTTYQELLVRY